MAMYRKPSEDVPQVSTIVWVCTSNGCNVWMRDNFSFASEPDCWSCGTPLVRREKLLPLLDNSGRSYLKK